jgi:four helix bundle protein
MIHNNLEILKHCKELMKEIHQMTVVLSKIQVFGEAKHFTQSISTVTSSIAASCRNKNYNYDFIKYLVNDYDDNQSCHHLETLFEKGNLTPENLYAALRNKFERLCRIINGFKQYEENDTIFLQ